MMLRSCRVWSLAALLLAAVHAQEESGMSGEEGGLESDGLSDDALTEEQLQAMHGKIDTNGDSKVSMDEVMKYSDEMRKRIATKDIRTVLEEMDADKDGKLSLDELIKDMQNWGDAEEEDPLSDKKEVEARKDLETQKFKLADENKDGFVDEQELPAMFYPETHDGVLELTAKSTMAQKDKNGDGFLTLSEFWEGDQSGEAEAVSEEMYIADEEKADFANLDRDKNEKLDLEELKEWESGRFHTRESMKKLFDMADSDSDLHLTADELKGVREQLAGSDAQYHLMEWAEHHEL